MFLSVFDIYKIGIGPSSSHTMGPMSAASKFLEKISNSEWKEANNKVARLYVSLHGSLAYTGVGHGTDRAIVLGLCGMMPDTIDPDAMGPMFEEVKSTCKVCPKGHEEYRFDMANDLFFDKKSPLPGHSNGMMFKAFDDQNNELLSRVYYSIGGGFIVDEDELESTKEAPPKPDASVVPFPFANAKQMLEMAEQSNLSIPAMKRANEIVYIGDDELDRRLDQIWAAMDRCIDRGITEKGIMPGGLNVQRRAKDIHDKLREEWKINRQNPLLANDWLSVYAMAVNEENAAGGRVVTSPTNGAAGVIPSVLRYYLQFHLDADPKGIRDFLLTSATIGGIIKANASISGAEVGCQGEVGSAAAMAAAGLAQVMGGTPAQVENAAEIALEHHLGMTCDPVGGLVQIPCIERNALGAVKAVTAASLALKGDGVHFVPLDACIETMRQTGIDMSDRYKETSEGGLAVNLVEC